MRLHVRAQNSVDPRLIAALLPEPGQQVRVEPHGDDLFAVRQDDLGIFPELVIRGVCVGVSFNARVNLGIAHPAQLAPVRAAPSLRGFRGVASSIVFHGVPLATLK